MSAPAKQLLETEYIGLAYLAANTVALLSSLKPENELSADQRHVLERASSLLKDISTGARFVNSGTGSGALVADGLRKLSYAVEPLRAIQGVIEERDLAAYMQALAASVHSYAQGQSVDADTHNLRVAQDFFAAFHTYMRGVAQDSKRHRADQPPRMFQNFAFV